MDFGEILKKWESEKHADWEKVREEKERSSGGNTPLGPSRTVIRKMAPQDSIDLHGMDSDSAEKALARFMSSARSRGLRKVLIIHGKGTHSPEGPVLRRVVHGYLQRCSFAGETGTPGRSQGGSGATWVILKKKK
jgi:DNA-nicking Smr family endonuclease